MSKHELDFTGMSRSAIESRLSLTATKMAVEHWGVRLINGINVDVNGRLTSTLGRMNYYSKANKWIEMSKRIIDYGAPEVIEDVLLHEVTHWVLLHKGLPFSDGHPYFEDELVRVGAKASGKFKVGMYHVYDCECEDSEHVSLRRMNGYQCTTCEEPLAYSYAKAENGQGVKKILEEV